MQIKQQRTKLIRIMLHISLQVKLDYQWLGILLQMVDLQEYLYNIRQRNSQVFQNYEQ
jgi:hypothetical protein